MGLPAELPLSLFGLTLARLRLGMRLGLLSGDTMGEARGVSGVRGLLGTRVSELTADVMGPGLHGDIRLSLDADPIMLLIMLGARSRESVENSM